MIDHKDYELTEERLVQSIDGLTGTSYSTTFSKIGGLGTVGS